MKTAVLQRLLPLLPLAALAASPSAPASAPAAPVAAAAAEDSAHAELRAVKNRVADAINAGKIDAALEELTPDVVVTWHNAEVSRGREEVRAYHNRMMSGASRIVKAFHAEIEADRLSVLYNGDTAIAAGTTAETFELAAGLQFTLHGRWSAVLVRQDGRWRVASLHTSSNLFDNPLLSSARRQRWWFAVGGLLLGLLAGRLLFRRRA